jgi:peptide/nickel transport system ATP-binding protein
VGLPEPERRIDDYPFRLSGGQKQRVMIAMTLAAEPDYLVADEPTTALDVTIQRQILDLLQQLQREQGLGLLLITHDLAVVAGMAQHVALMYAGQIVEMARAEDFFAAPRHPYARLLLQAVPDAAQRGRRLAAIAGNVPALTQTFSACRFAPRCPLAHEACQQGEPALLPRAGDRWLRCVLRQEAPSAQALRADAGVEAQAPSAAASEPLLRVQHLSVHFPVRSGVLQRVQREFTAVDDVSFDLWPGQTLALVGESGCGKTTLGKALLQLLRGTARVGGGAWLGERDLFTLNGNALLAARREVQIIFQDPFASLNPRLRVADILEEGLLTLRPELDAPARRARVAQWCERVGLPGDAMQRYPHEFSGGQRQRLAIARALAVEPRLVVCDEPTSALDVSVQAQILNLLHDLQRDTGVALLFITHNLGVVAYLAQQVVVMQAGRVVEAGPTEQVLKTPRQAYTRTLLAAVPRMPGV